VPIFRPRTRIEILREMVARVIARSKLVGVTRNSVVFHLLAAASNEDAEQYLQMVRLRNLFSIDLATGSDLDDRAKEIVPAVITRRNALYATTQEVFSRPGTTGTVAIPVGTQIAAQDANGLIRFRTTIAGSIPNLSSTSAPIDVIAIEAGTRGNVAAGTIVKQVTKLAGVTGITNPAKASNGFDRESDESFRARLKAFIQSISRGTPRALEGFARQVILTDGRRVIYARVVEPAIPTGTVRLFIDDGTGSVETYDSQFISSPDTIVAAALGGERNLYTTERPIRDDGSFVLKINSVAQTRGVDYELNSSIGQVELNDGVFPTGLTAGDVVTANYRFYTGLIKETQRVIDGDSSNYLYYPGVRAGGIQVIVQAATAVYQSVEAAIAVLSDYDVATVQDGIRSVIQDYINTLDIGGAVIASEIVERAMGVGGVYNFKLTNLSGTSPPDDQVILDTQVARIISGSITLT
jgi:uncharacterized phage protein gp47/JayE